MRHTAAHFLTLNNIIMDWDGSNKKYATTFDELPDNVLVGGRRMGNTTRMIDHAIQLLFDGYVVKVIDHYQYGKHRQANEHLFWGILKRLGSEHPSVRVNVDKGRLTIEIINK